MERLTSGKYKKRYLRPRQDGGQASWVLEGEPIPDNKPVTEAEPTTSDAEAEIINVEDNIDEEMTKEPVDEEITVDESPLNENLFCNDDVVSSTSSSSQSTVIVNYKRSCGPGPELMNFIDDEDYDDDDTLIPSTQPNSKLIPDCGDNAMIANEDEDEKKDADKEENKKEEEEENEKKETVENKKEDEEDNKKNDEEKDKKDDKEQDEKEKEKKEDEKENNQKDMKEEKENKKKEKKRDKKKTKKGNKKENTKKEEVKKEVKEDKKEVKKEDKDDVDNKSSEIAENTAKKPRKSRFCLSLKKF